MNTILWALSSKCNFGCKYCYLKFEKENNPINNKNTENNADVNDKIVINFIKKLEEYKIKRVFIAGAEPLSNPEKTFDIIKKIKGFNIQVVLCTNGYLINKFYKEIIATGVDAVSISLDSYKKEYNDRYRIYPKKDGFDRVVEGIEILKSSSNIKIGIYTVLTKLNMLDLEKTYKFVAELGADYYVFQPIFLNKEAKLFEELTLNENSIVKLENIIFNMYKNASKTKLPNKEYIKLMLESIKGDKKCIKNCFAGNNLFFITPDGTVHVCPSNKIISKETNPIKISDENLKNVFIEKELKIENCSNFSEDCVNMWQLIAFDEFL